MIITPTGAKLARFPVGLRTKVGVLHRLTTAETMGLAILQSLLLRADEVIQ